ncbi:MAG: hypothetical protein MRJ65_07415 [Candidatus Brocadiaceae bacterium]|nr:hypothetical protein [Candidatus Brocadiaceae bacterium]
MKNIGYSLPKSNREMLIRPALSSIPEAIRINRERVHGYRFKINTIPFQVVREHTRKELLNEAVQFTDKIKSFLCNAYPAHDTINQLNHTDDFKRNKRNVHNLFRDAGKCGIPSSEIPIIQTGHEPIFYHPGIWIKNHLAQHLAKKLNGVGINMVVDNDTCKRGFLSLPVLSKSNSSIHRAEFVSGKNSFAYEEIVINDSRVLDRFKEEVITVLHKQVFDEKEKNTFQGMQSMFEKYFDCITKCYLHGGNDFVRFMTTARYFMEKMFGLNNLEISVSQICKTEGFLQFFFHILCHAPEFANVYNKKLAEYRALHRIRSKSNPFPDLYHDERCIELPFWVWQSGGERKKCYVLRDNECLKITNTEDVFITLNKRDDVSRNISYLQCLMKSEVKFRPRAITTTMFSRLFFSDIFIHGIGGAKYDSITDEIIREFFCAPPPLFIVVSTTLLLPFDMRGVNMGTLHTLQKDLADMKHNPERYASPADEQNHAFNNKIKEKQRLLKSLSFCSKSEKKRCFQQIKHLNTQMFQHLSAGFLKKQEELGSLRQAMAYNDVATFREYPVCIYPTKFLQECFLSFFSAN